MDGVALMHTVSQVRSDVKIVANHILPMIFPATEQICIGIRNMAGKMSHRHFAAMNNHLKAGGVLIICPAGKLASVSLKGLNEHPWHSGFAQLSIRNNAALIPINIEGRNSLRYYITALSWRKISNLMVIRECLRHQGKVMKLRIGQRIMLPVPDALKPDLVQLAQACQQHMSSLGNDQPGILPTCAAIAEQGEKSQLIEAIQHGEVLKTFSNGKALILYRHQGETHTPVLDELGRLREICFREFGAGSGMSRDNDQYDYAYHHLILWDSWGREIVGAYRVQPAGEIIARQGVDGLYSNSLFNYRPDFLPYIAKSIEIGRGFVQPQYQKTKALDYLWQGVFYFASRHPEYTYFIGMLTIPRVWPDAARQLIARFYSLYFSSAENFCQPVKEYLLDASTASSVFAGDDFSRDWTRLKDELNRQGCDIPWPYKQAAKWYNPGGSKILSFAEDNDFNSIVGLNFCDIRDLKKTYCRHYIENIAVED
jgi:putative hemolysin